MLSQSLFKSFEKETKLEFVSPFKQLTTTVLKNALDKYDVTLEIDAVGRLQHFSNSLGKAERVLSLKEAAELAILIRVAEKHKLVKVFLNCLEPITDAYACGYHADYWQRSIRSALDILHPKELCNSDNIATLFLQTHLPLDLWSVSEVINELHLLGLNERKNVQLVSAYYNPGSVLNAFKHLCREGIYDKSNKNLEDFMSQYAANAYEICEFFTKNKASVSKLDLENELQKMIFISCESRLRV